MFALLVAGAWCGLAKSGYTSSTTPQSPCLFVTTTSEESLSVIDHANQNSPFVDAARRWRVNLDFGLEPGSFMPRRFPQWAASGARLGIPVELIFTSNPNDAIEGNGATADNLVQGRLGNRKRNTPLKVYQVQVSTEFSSTFVSDRGEESVTFAGGGYSMERSLTSITSSATATTSTSTPKPRFLLRFWIDCISGAKRKDVTLEPQTRILGTIPIWDYPDTVAQLEQELQIIKIQRQNNDAFTQKSNNEDAYGKVPLSFMDRFFGKRKQSKAAAKDEESLSYRQEQIERLLPLPGSVVADANIGITIAPKGSLVMPYEDTNFIVGAFSMRPAPP